MDFVRLGSSNLKVSRLCLGAMGTGDASWRSWVLDSNASRPIVKRALDLGINFFDTCDYYSAGASETILGEILLSDVPRDSVVIATKGGNPMQRHPNGRGYSRKHIVEAVDASLRRLKTDYIDLYQTHIWDRDTNLEELVEVFADLVRAGKVLYVGATTMPAWAFATALGIAARKGRPGFVSMQCEYNPSHRECERELLELCRHAGVAVIPFSPMARGFLSADRRRPENWSSRTESDDYTRKHYHRPADFAVFEAVSCVARRHATSSSRVAVAWTVQRAGITAPIFGATQVDHVDDAVEALSLRLSDDDLAMIAAAYETRPLGGDGH